MEVLESQSHIAEDTECNRMALKEAACDLWVAIAREVEVVAAARNSQLDENMVQVVEVPLEVLEREERSVVQVLVPALVDMTTAVVALSGKVGTESTNFRHSDMKWAAEGP